MNQSFKETESLELPPPPIIVYGPEDDVVHTGLNIHI